MADATAVSVAITSTPDNTAEETFLVTTNDQTGITLTPTRIKAIGSAIFTAANAKAGNYTATYANGFVMGAATLAFVAETATIWLVTLRGKIA